jgi:hypothetical protein
MQETTQSNLGLSDLVVDAIYAGGRKGNASDDPLPQLLGVSNRGGFRYLGRKDSLKLVVLTTSLIDPSWPDELDPINGVFTYYGDNKLPGRELHSTPRFGNQILRDLFAMLHGRSENRKSLPPVLVFAKTGNYRDVKFLGLAVPGVRNLSQNEDLVAIWKVFSGRRFQNYRAKFTILDVTCVPRAWLHDVRAGNALQSHCCPPAWQDWVQNGSYRPLSASPTVEHRTRQEQLPDTDGFSIIELLCTTFSPNPFAFEHFAAELIRIMMPNISTIDLTRPSRDGGRDAIGKYRLGKGASSIDVEFALEAKCYDPMASSVGVRETSRLISRLRHRQFGILVTTSYLNPQAYKEIKEDGHPIIIISGKDIVEILRREFADLSQLHSWLVSFLK